MTERSTLPIGHRSAVLCCDASHDGTLLASGDESGWLCIHDLPSGGALAHRWALSGVKPPAAAAAVGGVVFHPSAPHTLFAALGSSVRQLDLRTGSATPVAVAPDARDEVSCLAVNHRGSYLAAADDSGDVRVFDLSAGSRNTGGSSGGAAGGSTGGSVDRTPCSGRYGAGIGADGACAGSSRCSGSGVAGGGGESCGQLRVTRCFQEAHNPLASAVTFRQHRPWELVTGGLDCRVVRWDFSRGSCLASWALAGQGAGSGGGGDGGAQRMCNPPMVHALAVAGDRGGPLGRRAVAAAGGDGVVAVFDADADAGAGRARGASRGARRSGGGGGAAGGAGVAAGFNVLLGPGLGGHTRPVSSVVFMGGSEGRLLLSGGEDRLLLLWDWQRAAAAEPAAGSGGGSDPPAAPGDDAGDAGAPLVWRAVHGRKINALCCASAPDGGGGRAGDGSVFVADTSRVISRYQVRG